MPTNAIGARGMTIDELLAFHRQHFGDARMETTLPPEQAAPLTSQQEPEGPATQAPTVTDDAPAQDTPPDNEHGFPPNTRVDDMTLEQQAAYWKHKSRRHEQQWKSVIDKNLTPEQVLAMQDRLAALDADRANESAQQAIETARADADRAARLDVGGQYARTLLEAVLNGSGKTPEEIERITSATAFESFVEDGHVDTAKVFDYAATLAPAGGRTRPDTGQGRRGTTESTSGVEAGRALYRQRHKK